MIDPKKLGDQFYWQFRRFPQRLAFAPGRVNLIGEHIDYVGGTVLPMAVSMGTSVGVAHRDDGVVRISSTVYRQLNTIETTMADDTGRNWVRMAQLIVQQMSPGGADIFVDSDLPVGQGMSSSASYCVALAAAFLRTKGLNGIAALARLCQKVEVEATGTQCGLMDQYSVIAGGLIELDTADLTYIRLAGLPAGLSVAVISSGQQRSLSSAGYNTRRAELQSALELAGVELAKLPLKVLAVRPDESLYQNLPDVLQRRLRHVLTEQLRAREFCNALEAGDIQVLGNLINESHRSLSVDYEVSTPEINMLVALLADQPGVHGVRMMGGGFGGAVLVLADTDALPGSVEDVFDDYTQMTGLTAKLFPVSAGAGAVCAPYGSEMQPVVNWLQ